MTRTLLRSIVIGTAACALGACGGFRITAGPVQPFSPAIRWGGRAVAVSVHPDQPAFMIAASESGGLFRSDTRGRTWVHVTDGPGRSVSVRDVEYVRARDRVRIIATTGIELHTASTGGIWISRNGGLSFNRPRDALPASGPRCPERTAAYGIGLDRSTDRIYVGTDCGYAFSDDGGDSWTHRVIDPSIPVDRARTQDRVLNIVADGNRVYALGKNGLYYSTNGGADWTAARRPMLRNLGFRDAPPRLAISPDSPDHAFLAIDTDSARLFVTTNDGRDWNSVRADPDGARQAIVLTTPHDYSRSSPAPARGYTLYWGNGPALFRAAISSLDPAAPSFAWQTVAIDHADIMDVAFDGRTGEPLLLASDGGVHLTGDGGASWRITGAGTGGFHALQVYGIAGQFQNRGGRYEHTDLYFGTHDNGLWYSIDGGTFWSEKGDPEGGGLGALRSVDDYSESWITGYRCATCFTFLTRSHFQDSRRWNDAGDGKLSQPMHLVGTRFIQFGTDTTRSPGRDSIPARREHYLYRSDRFDAAWGPTLQIDEPAYGTVKRSGTANPWLTYGVQTGWNADGSRTVKLRVVSGAGLPRGGPRLFDASIDLGSLGIRGYQFEWTPVFGVSPVNPNFIIAPDIVDGTVKVSIDGGLTWTEDAALRDVLTDSGRFELYARWNDGEAGGLLVNEISFLPENPNHILVGTRFSGIAHSGDGGLTWRRIPGSERIPHITGFFWDYPNGRVIVSSFGRGLWVLHFGRDEFDRIPDRTREVPPPDPTRETLRWRPRVTAVSVDGETAMNGMTLVRTGSDLVISGAGFAFSPDQRSIVRFRIDGAIVGEAFPDRDGRFRIRLPVRLTPGSWDVEIVQETAAGTLRDGVSFAVAAWGRRDGGTDRP